MLPEPDLFSSVNINISNHGSYSQSAGGEDTNLLAAAADQAGNYDPDKTVGQEVEVFENNKRYPRCQPYTVGVATVISRGSLSNSNSKEGSIDPHERRVRWWYLTVIVLLYIGLTTSFCLNVSLLLKNYPEPSAEIRLSEHQIGREETELSRGKGKMNGSSCL
jgi:hypothetical protein